MGFFSKILGTESKTPPKIEIAFPDSKLTLGNPFKVKMTITAGSEPLPLTNIRADLFQFTWEEEKKAWDHALCSKEIRPHNKTLQPGEVLTAEFTLTSEAAWFQTYDKCYYQIWIEGEGTPEKLTTSSKIEAVKPGTSAASTTVSDQEEEEDEFGPKRRAKSIEDYLERFKAMVNELKSNPDIVIIRWNSFPALNDVQMNALVEKYGLAVEEPQRTFFKQTNGLQLLWVHKKSRYYNSASAVYSADPLPWDYLRGKPRFFDGSVMILPLEEQLKSSPPALQTNIPESTMVNYRGTEYSLKKFLGWIHLFDAYHESEDTNYVAAKTGDPVIVMSASNHMDWYKYHLNLYDAYLELVLACKGTPEGRWKQMKGKDAFKEGDYRYFFKNKSDVFEISTDNIVLQDFFPQSNEMRLFIPVKEDCQAFKMAQSNPPMTQDELNKTIELHNLWKKSGGSATGWSIMSIVRGEVRSCSSYGSKGTEGAQGFITQKRWDGVNAKGIDVSHMGMIDSYVPGIDFTGSNLSNCCLTDSFLEGANFDSTVLLNADFSRSILRKASFRNADLTDADFEDSDLRGADFTDAKNIHLAKFPGASLKGVKQNIKVN